MLKLTILAGFWKKFCRKGMWLSTLALILASTWIPCAHAQSIGITVSENPACPGDLVNVSVTNNDNGEYSPGGLVVTGCTISWSDGQTFAYGYLYMPGQENVQIVAHNDNYFSTTSLTVINGANIPGQTTNRPVAGSIVSNGTLSATNLILCAVGSGITAPTNSGTVVSGTNETVVTSICGNVLSSNAVPVLYTQDGAPYFTWTSNGVLVTNIPCEFTTAGSYSFEGYVSYIPPAGFAFTNAITVDLGPLTVCVFSFTNNCTPGSVSLTNTSASTNFILGVAPTLSVSNIASDAALEFITNCECDTIINADVTSNLPPIILSNWWTVSGPGTNYTNNGSGLFTGPLSPIPTNGGTGTATFYVSYTTWTNSANSAPSCCTNTNSLQVPFNVLSLNIVDTNNQPITNANNNNLVIVGQNIALNAQTLGGAFSNYQWTVDSTVYTNFYVSQDPSWTNGYPTPLTMLSNTNVFFFWVDAGSKNVSCSAVSGGLTNSNTVAFTVVRPIATVSTTRGGVSMGYAYSNLYMNFGLATGQPGILFSNTIIMPPGFSNIMYYTEWVQIITSWISILTISNSVTNIINYTNQTPGLLALDSAYPYNDIITNVFVYPITSDSPAIPLAFNNQIAASKSQYSQMAVMFKPFNTNNNWVCLWIVNWNCNGTANGFGPNPSHWTLSGTNISVSASADSGGTYLTWTNNVESFKTNYPTR